MAITRATDLAVAKSDGTAETVAAACWDAANRLDRSDAKAASAIRQLRKHARELLELHSIPADEVLIQHVAAVPENGSAGAFLEEQFSTINREG
jgi:hypothetical protein